MSNTDIQQFSDGDLILLNLNQDITGATNLEYILSSPTDVLYRVPTIGTVDITRADNTITFTAFEYLTYETVAGDTDIAGQWQIQGSMTLTSNKRLSAVGQYCVLTSLPEQLL